MPLLRRNTLDHAIWHSVTTDYPATPDRFAPGDVVLDLGCHTGAFCCLTAGRGATVVGYEASPANYALAKLNTAALGAVDIRWAAVWRSDRPPGRRRFLSWPDRANTGGGSVLFTDPAQHRRHAVLGGAVVGASGDAPVADADGHEVATVGLDAILTELGRVRLLKIDIEGAEFPVLATASRLHHVDLIVGEYHEFTEAQMANLPAEARIGPDPYDGPRLRRILAAAGFEATLGAPANGGGIFTARRR